MPLTRVEAHNFKSFRDLDVMLGSLNVLIGANASGKSNFVQLLRFVRDIANFGLDNATSIQGGPEYIANLLLGTRKITSVTLTIRVEGLFSWLAVVPRDSTIKASADELRYEFGLHTSPKHSAYAISTDKLEVFRTFFRNGNSTNHSTVIGNGTFTVANEKGKIVHSSTLSEGITPEQANSSYWEAMWTLVGPQNNSLRGLLLENLQNRSLLSIIPIGMLTKLPIYDFNTKLPKQTAQVTGKLDLEEDGSNLVIALKNILEDKGQRREFSNLLRDVLPFAESVDVRRLTDRFLHFRLRERYSGDTYLPASLLSDGTIHVIALIVALFFNDKPLIVIEEPERNIHPYLLARVAELLKDASRNKQIIVTTHNPEIVKNVALEDLLFVSRDHDGFSTIRRPAESADVRVFLENEIGIDELFARNLLGA